MRAVALWGAGCAALMLTGGGGAAEARGRYEAEITRTTYGIPHIVAKDWRGAGYGVAYAYAEDNLCLLAEEFATVAGTRALHFGPEGMVTLGFQQADNVTSDVAMRALIDLPALRRGWRRQAREMRALAEGYVAGYNRFLRDAGADGIPAECRGKAWVRPITLDDMLRLTQKQMLLASSLALAPAVASAAPPGAKQTAAAGPTTAWRLPRQEDLDHGSNGWAFGGEVTRDGRGLLIGNPHFPWTGPSRFWQLHVTIPGQYDAMGVGLAGTPLVTLGFNKDIAWTHTVTAARHFTLHQLALDPADPTRYLVDGKSVSMQPRTITVPLPGGASETRTLYTTRFGPVLSAPGNGLIWNQTTAFALKDANLGNPRALGTWMRIGQARTVAEVEAAVSETLGIPWVNTIVADRGGNALHADVTAVPNVTASLLAECKTPLSGLFAAQAALLDGSRSACDWQAAPGTPVPGLMPASDQARTTRRDYLTNSNDSYWISNPRIPHPALSPILGLHGTARQLRTRSNFIETEAMLAAGKVDHAAARALAFGNRSQAAELAMPDLLALCAQGPGENAAAARGCAALAGWDRRFEVDSRGTALFHWFWLAVEKDPGLWRVPFDPADPVGTPHALAIEGARGERLLTALGEAAARLEAHGIALDAPWGEVQRAIMNGAAFPIHGGQHELGVLNMQRSVEGEDGRLQPTHGTSYIQIVGFDEKGPVAEAILSYSQSTNPASPHFADQTPNYVAKQWHRLPFHADEVRAVAIAAPKRIAE